MLTKTTMLIAMFIMAIPLVPVNAAKPAIVSTSPITADFGSAFTSTVSAGGAANLAGYDISVRVNPDVITLTGATLSGTAFDPAVQNVLILRSDVIPEIGLVRFAVAILGGVTVGPSATLVNISGQVNDPTSSTVATASEYPSSVSFSSCTLAGLVNGNVIIIPSTCTGTTYMPPSNVALQSVGCRAVNDGFNTLSKGLTDGLFCRITNTGTSSITAGALFSYRSVGGVTGSVNGGMLTLAPGQFAEIDGTLTVPNANDIFIVSGTAGRVIMLADGSQLIASSGSSIFQVVVNVP